MKNYFFTLMFGFLFFAGTSVFAQNGNGNGNGATIMEVPFSFVSATECGSYQVDAVIKIISQQSGFVNNWKGTATNLTTNEVFPFSAIASSHTNGNGLNISSIHQNIAGQVRFGAVIKFNSQGLVEVTNNTTCIAD